MMARFVPGSESESRSARAVAAADWRSISSFRPSPPVDAGISQIFASTPVRSPRSPVGRPTHSRLRDEVEQFGLVVDAHDLGARGSRDMVEDAVGNVRRHAKDLARMGIEGCPQVVGPPLGHGFDGLSSRSRVLLARLRNRIVETPLGFGEAGYGRIACCRKDQLRVPGSIRMLDRLQNDEAGKRRQWNTERILAFRAVAREEPRPCSKIQFRKSSPATSQAAAASTPRRQRGSDDQFLHAGFDAVESAFDQRLSSSCCSAFDPLRTLGSNGSHW